MSASDLVHTSTRPQFPEGTDPLALDLLSRLMHLNPAHRPSAAEALRHAYFAEAPLPAGEAERYRPGSRRAEVQVGPKVIAARSGPPSVSVR